MSPEIDAADYIVSTAPPSPARCVSTLRAIVPAELAGARIDAALAQMFGEFSRTRLQAWLREGQVRIDGRPAQPRGKVWGGEAVELAAHVATQTPDAAEDIPLSTVFEDDDLLVIDKTAGLVVHPGNGNRDGTLLNALLHRLPALADLPRAGIVHRLDKDTSGLLVVAKTLAAQTDLVRQLQARSVKREYFAVVVGVPPGSGSVDAAMGRHPTQRTKMAVVHSGKPAITHFALQRHGAHWALLKCSLETGRTHQIRVHMAHIGHPLVGDPVYLTRAAARPLPESARTFPRQALHAQRLTLDHPRHGHPMTWESPLPADLQELLVALRSGEARG